MALIGLKLLGDPLLFEFEIYVGMLIFLTDTAITLGALHALTFPPPNHNY